MNHSLLLCLMLLITSCYISRLVDNALPTLSPEVKPTEVPSKLVPHVTHSMME